ncbi:hypothetical protein P168DRAFT_273062 [Aspergillus campestris IBT 28561]|uniref:Carboxylic ester hydrolase n=1 Tax=Aspergillus campestris (strain IBT 28561) TaxID=1392248 RepID=A0A2I1CWX7_ASPC2|nr:uncharacterized protein P168DRAFT_273062 [Aspergillus campestris IBT 28561]PKY02128.1 hypothetical protein P168DRAFT_273062 [Aspergillus campestris IBT 28561]
METLRDPYRKALAYRGHVEGVTISAKDSCQPLCHYFGGLRYALPPVKRFCQARKLPPTYSYGTKDQPGLCGGLAGVCPQPDFLTLSSGNDWTEDCFQCNIWVPLGEPPQDGWPVLFFIHGGFLQFGTPNTFSAAALLGETDFQAIIVMPAYRLGVFGFLSSSEIQQDIADSDQPLGNQGFWDQRLALEWTRDNIALFGGNPAQITLSGYSAGAYSAFYQLAYDIHLPPENSIIKRACIWSNSPAVQPKSPATAQTQFNQLLSALRIPTSLPASEKLTQLRALPPATVLSAATSISLHQFRPTTDSTFIQPTLFQSFDTGAFARRLAARNIHIMLGECRDEHNLYATWLPPPDNSRSSLRSRLLADYPQPIVDTLLHLYAPSDTTNTKTYPPSTFGHIYADIQVHTTQRGLIQSLAANGATHLLHRYRIEYRLNCAAKTIPREWGVTHATDMYLWFWGNGEVLEPAEKRDIRAALIDPWARFVRGDTDDVLGWGTNGPREMRTLMPDGSVRICRDELWDEAMRVWMALRGVGESGVYSPRL